MEAYGFYLEEYESSGGSEEAGSDSQPPSPPAAGEPSPPPSSAEDGSSSDDELPEYLARLGAWKLDEEEEEEEQQQQQQQQQLAAPLRQLSLAARQQLTARKRLAAPPSESDEEPAAGQILVCFSEAREQTPESLFRQLRRLLPLEECRRTLAECNSDWLAAHWRLRQHAATLLAMSPPLEEREGIASTCWQEGRSMEQQQRAQLECEEESLLRRRLEAAQQGNVPGVQQADQELDELQKRQLSIAVRVSYAKLQLVNQYSLGLETVDLHAQKQDDARRIVADVVRHNTERWPSYRHGRHMVVFITGQGKHSGPAGSTVKPAVKDELAKHRVPYRDDKSGVCAFFSRPANT